MKRIILLLITFLALAYWSSTVAQVKSEKVVIKKTDVNTIELRAKLYGNFKELEALPNKSAVEDYLRQNYDVGFMFENFRALGWDVAEKPMGELNRWLSNPSGQDTIVFTTLITNAPTDLAHYVQTYFKPKSEKYKFRLEGTEQVGDRLQDFLCEVVDVSIEDRLLAEKNDTVTLTANATMEDGCTQGLTYDWKFSTYDEVIDTVVTDTTYVNSDWKNWGSGRNGFISQTDNQIVFEVMNKNWDNRRWTVYVTSGVGREAKSNNFKLRVTQ